MVTTAVPNQISKPPSKVEGLKAQSQHLLEPIATEMRQDTTHFSEDGVQILKFHGSYQQDNRDHRVKGQEKEYSFMLRTRSPGGVIPAQLYLTLDRLADTYGSGTLRATTRQGFQLHGVLKRNLKATIAEIVKNMGSTLGACGDLNRNVMAPPAPYTNRPDYQYARQYANQIADLLTPQTGAYYEIWLDGEKAITAEEAPEVIAARQKQHHQTLLDDPLEPIYGTQYMPRKFKIAVTVPGDNSVDLFSQDLSLVVISSAQGELEGFNVYAGGGLGRTHNKEETFVRMADPMGYVAKADVYALVKALVATQRDYGDRVTRRHARLKYLLHDWGVAKFTAKVEEYFGQRIQPLKSLPEFKYLDFLGWQDQGDGRLFLGISIQNGRVKDEGTFRLKSALKQIVSRHQLPIILTPHQNLIVQDIDPGLKPEIQAILNEHGVLSETAIDSLERLSMACPALPTCGLAITESERALPGINQRIRNLMNRLGLGSEQFVIRMTGCPNGCARPYLAELGFVGITPETYQVWLGGSPNQTRMARAYQDKLPIAELETFLEPLLVYYRQSRQPQESFGDFCNRMDFDALRDFATSHQPEPAKAETAQPETTPAETTQPKPASSPSRNKIRHRIDVRNDLYEQLKVLAAEQGKSLPQITSEAVAYYLEHSPKP
jgi:sulfite reductase (ferredoxin)